MEKKLINDAIEYIFKVNDKQEMIERTKKIIRLLLELKK